MTIAQRLADAPEPPPRIWVTFRYKDFGPHPKAGGSSNYIGDANNGPIDADATYILATPEALAASPEVAALIAEALRDERAKWDAHRRAQDKRIRMQREELRWMHVICQGVHMASVSIASGYRKQREELEALKEE